MLKKILIANRGEIAVRIVQACETLGVGSVAVHTARDAAALHASSADEAFELTQHGPITPYLDAAALVEAALETGADAVHPGYGFLAESAAFAQAVTDAGLTWIGPRPQTISSLGDKRQARRIAVEAGITVVPGSDGVIEGVEEVVALGRTGGWPVVVKAALGGGGRGMRVVHDERDVADLVDAARRESLKAFGDDSLLAERFIVGARHVEVQIIADQYGTVVAVGDRECSVQRRHQKLVEEAPASFVSRKVRDALATEAERLMAHVGYVGAGTVEFLVLDDEHFFLEVNTRIQVEHPVTEAVTGIDIVAEQIRVAAGERLSFECMPEARGHAIEVRVNAEDPFHGFAPASGRLEKFTLTPGAGVRVDAGYTEGDVVPPDFDSLVAKVVVHAPDRDRALRRLARILDSGVVRGMPTTLPALADIVAHPDFVAGEVTTEWFERVVEPTLRADDPRAHQRDADILEVSGALIRIARPPTARRAASRRQTGVMSSSGGDGSVRSPMIGLVLVVHVCVGDEVARGDALATVEAMKMENIVRAERSGVVRALSVVQGETVKPGQLLMTMETVEAKV
ncbi:hypothetical protein CJ178_31900 [Rhodococcus sp. ACPA4]|uniref:acetyl/propionyl/methylcrotonyl-CoA carboxylase subunit alpha n=1 Tax=Rhodococcus sp. ACPA4 TaxID=2028571 RepID=UPI000BB0D5C2|nr:biotin carboxylase N-terminal domain-containing protein [Rhodococcus sp. ACPA4]PBC36023.1 hypothetical protein CJ178_31900 [Rhodococcus sp. ACPA4]